MRKSIAALLAVGLSLGTVPLSAQLAGGSPPPGTTDQVAPTADTGDDLPNVLEEKRRALRTTAIDMVMKGEATPQEVNGSTVVNVGQVGDGGTDATSRRASKAPDQYVELENEGTDRIFTLLVQFGNQRHPDYPDQDTDPDTVGPLTFDGPLHNAIPEPLADDNSTIWQPDYSQAYFQDLYFGDAGETLKTYYEKQSSGRYSVEGEVSDWVTVPYNEARYGRSNGFPCDQSVCNNTWNLVQDGMNQWAADQAAAGSTDQEIADYLATFDVYDRNDFDNDADFNEPDGYLDHMQIVHSGGDQADGDEQQGEDAVWSHRWYAFDSDVGVTGPPANLVGGTEIASTGTWVGDYTIQPENGGLSTIAHEFGHDLGLPDHYDTAGGENGVNWWTIMAQSRLGAKNEAIGSRAGDLGSWDKLVLGWLDYDLLFDDEDVTLELGPHEYNSAKAQAVVVLLPDKTVSQDYGPPFAGAGMWWSTSGDNLSTSMQRTVDLTSATTADLALKARFDIEADFDYLYVQASTNGGASWTSLDGTVGGVPFILDGSDKPAISGSSDGSWVDVAVDLDAFAGAPVDLRFFYRTDGGVAPDGFFADDVTISADGSPIVTSGAEGGDEGWTLDGFTTSAGVETGTFQHYYLASNRTYESFDQYMKTGPYNFGFLDTKPNFVEHFSYETGLLVTYVDTSQPDNNTSEHPGAGLVLPVDSHPDPLKRVDGVWWRGRVQGYDAPFGLSKTKGMTLHILSQANKIKGLPGNPSFNDQKNYYSNKTPGVGVKLPKVGVKIDVLATSGTSMTIHVH